MGALRRQKQLIDRIFERQVDTSEPFAPEERAQALSVDTGPRLTPKLASEACAPVLAIFRAVAQSSSA